MFSRITRNTIPALVAVLFFGLAGSAAADFRATRGPKAEGQYIVVFKEGNPARNAALELAASHGANAKRIWENALNGALFTNMNEARARALANNPKVAWVEENGIGGEDVTQNSAPWGLDRIDQQVRPLSTTYNYAFDGNGIHAYVIDSGILNTHTEFGNRATLDYDNVDDDQNGLDCRGHGTHVAGTLGGSTYGVAKGIRLHAVRVLDCNGQGTVDQAIDAVNWVMNNAQLPAVANMSLRYAPSDALDTAVNNASNAGIFFAVSAGNQNLEACSQSPARAAQSFAVAATDSLDTRASFSNFGNCTDIFAPGVGILSAWHTSDSATQTLDGTSMATPHVAAAAALLFDEDSTLTPAQIRQRLIARSTPNVVSSAGTNSPNRLLYSLTLVAGGLPQMPAWLDVQPWMCNGYNDVFWTTADGATSYQLYRSSSSSFTSPVLAYQGTATDYLANVGGTTYFRVRSCGSTGCSAWRYGDQAALKVNGCL